MRRRTLDPAVSLVLLATATVAFTTGLVILTQLHMGDGSLRAGALGLSRIAWLDLHRLSALGAVGALAVHLALHWRALVGRVRGAFGPRRPRGTAVELALYATFAVTTFTSLAAWWLVGGSAPLGGPALLGPTSHARHELVDVHHLSGLVALVLAAHHLAHRWGQLVRGLVRRRAPGGRPA